jgi:AcrR family transcriptional regulator
MSGFPASTLPSALIIAHPGHELRVHGWIERARPEVFVLTDGSGHQEVPRLDSTREVLRRAGAREGSVFGRFGDRDLYRMLMEGELDPLERLAHELADALVAGGVEVVASDAIEGYNPSHDLCRLLAESAVALASRRLERPIASYDFLLEGRPDLCPAELAPRAIRLLLDDAALERKLDAARSYPEIAGEVEYALQTHGPDAFRVECLRPAAVDLERQVPEPAVYELYGERQVAAGHYSQVLRFREHFLPAALLLGELARAT